MTMNRIDKIVPNDNIYHVSMCNECYFDLEPTNSFWWQHVKLTGLKDSFRILHEFFGTHTVWNHFGCKSRQLHGAARSLENTAYNQPRRGLVRNFNGRDGIDALGCDKPIDCPWFAWGNDEKNTWQSTVNLKCTKLFNWLVVSIHFPYLPSEFLEEEGRESFRLTGLILEEDVVYLIVC